MSFLPSTNSDCRRVIVVVLVALLVVLAGCNGLSGSQDNGDSAGGPSVTSGNGGGGDGSSGVGSFYDVDGNRMVIRNADLSVQVTDFEKSFRKIRRITDRHGGYVGDRSQNSDGDWDNGTMTLKVPARNFSAVRDAIEDLGRVENADVEALDFTSEYQNRQQRIRQLESDRAELRDLLNETDNASEARTLRNDLESIRSDLDRLRSEQSSLQQRQSMSTIRVELHEPASKKPSKSYETAFSFYDAFKDAFYGGLTAVKYVIVFFGYAIPLGIALLLVGVFGLGLYATWIWMRRRLIDLIGIDLGPRPQRPSNRSRQPPNSATDSTTPGEGAPSGGDDSEDDARD